jgi:hypothetical protein
MIPRFEKFKEDFLTKEKLYKGTTPFIDTSNVTNEDISLYSQMKVLNEIEDIKQESKASFSAILASVNTIKRVLLFWTILILIGFLASIIYLIMFIAKFSI